MIRNFTFATMAALFFASSSSQAGIIIQDDGGTDVGNGLTAFVISAVGTDGDTVQSLVDISFQGVYQMWKNVATDQPSPEVGEQSGAFWNSDWSPFDSAFSFDVAADSTAQLLTAAPGTSFSETNSEGNPNGVDTSHPTFGGGAFPGTAGLGDLSLNGQITYLQAGGFATKEFAYIVVPTGQQASYSAQFFTSTGQEPTDILQGVIGGGAPLDPMVLGDPTDGTDLSALLQAAFDNRDGGPAVVPIVVSNENGTYGELGLVGPGEIVRNDSFGGISVTLEPGVGEGVFNLVMDGNFGALVGGSLIDGTLVIPTENGGNLNYTFGATVPEPSTVLLAGLGLIGLVGFSRRK